MKKIIVPLVLSVPLFLLSGCGTQVVTYQPGYSSDYVYSVGYQPYWGNKYIYTTTTGCGYWGAGNYCPQGNYGRYYGYCRSAFSLGSGCSYW